MIVTLSQRLCVATTRYRYPDNKGYEIRHADALWRLGRLHPGLDDGAEPARAAPPHAHGAVPRAGPVTAKFIGAALAAAFAEKNDKNTAAVAAAHQRHQSRKRSASWKPYGL